MEKKTIGGFIAALRKANGLTQKQLADKLCVSDKAVSRWERDECAPDLTLIPVIAEIFGITTDELLRGQKNNPDAAEPAANAEVKVQQQTKRLLKNTLTKYQTYSILCFGIALLGFLVALVCNFGFLRGPLGFILGCVCTAAAVVLEVIFAIEAKAALEDVEFEPELLSESRLSIFRVCRNTAIGIAMLFAMTLPLTMVYDTYMGIEFESWLSYALLFCALAFVLGVIVFWVIFGCLVKNGTFTQSETAAKRNALRLRYIGIAAAVLVCVFILQALANSFLPEALMTGTSFDTWEAFKEYMETPMGDSWMDGNDMFFSEPIDVLDDESIYTQQTIADTNGNILCEYTERNMSVRRIHFNFEHSDDGLPVTVYTDQDYMHANIIMEDLVNPLFLLSYAAAVIIAVLLYCRKAKQYR